MKKLLFTLLSAVTLFSSCSSDNDPISQETDLDLVKYTVNLNVKSAGFEVDKAPLKRDVNYWPKFLQIIVYNESGTVYSDTILDQTKLGLEESMASISLELPKGNYFLSVLNTKYLLNNLADYILIPKNYNTDYYDRGLNDGLYRNEDIYYYTSTLNVAEDNNNNNEIVLEPMWSNITNIETKNSPTFEYPKGTSIIGYQITSRYYGFGIKSKLAKTSYPFLYKEFQWYDNTFNNLSLSNQLPIAIAKAEDKDLYLEICYIKKENYNGGGYITKIQRIKLPIDIENGLNYTISGTIPDVDNIDSGLMNISTEPFKDSNITFQ